MGLLHAALRPADEVYAVRAIMRHRQDLVGMAAQHTQHMQKTMTQMNLQLHHVINDITGLIGRAIVDAILDSERDPAKLDGTWRAEHLFTLRQSRQMYAHYKEQIEPVRCRTAGQ